MQVTECETVNRWMIDVGLIQSVLIDKKVVIDGKSYVHLSAVSRDRSNYGEGDRVVGMFLNGLSEDEIAEDTMLSIGYVRSILVRAGLVQKAKMLGGANKKRPVIQMTMAGVFIKEHDSIKDAGLAIGVNKTSIMMACQGKRNKAGGFKWEYKNQ